MEPTRYVAPAIAKPTGSWLRRGLVALFVEHRLPYQISVALDKLCRTAGLRHKTVTADGLAFRVRRLTCDERFVHNVVVNREYTRSGYEIHESDVIIDIGGNIGTFALLASREAPRGKVLTVEPNRENFELLRHNVALNQASNVLPIRAAVTGRPGQTKLFITSEGGFHSILADRGDDPNRYEMVMSLTLQDIFDRHGVERCHLLKLDCEGAEHEILHHLPAEYYARIDRIVMEYHGDENPATRRAQADLLVARLEAMGFRIDVYEEFVGFRGGFIRATQLPASRRPCHGDHLACPVPLKAYPREESLTLPCRKRSTRDADVHESEDSCQREMSGRRVNPRGARPARMARNAP